MLIYLKKKAQSTAEYVIVLGLVVGALVAMQQYIKRGLQGRMREAVDFTDQGLQLDDTQAVQFSGAQYEPYYLQSQFNSQRNTDEAENLLADGAVQRNLNQEHSQREGHQTIDLGRADND